ncbi:MAG: sulfurtransferase TusA family protein [Mediterranea sp.]|jgi:TusA-related sulfurtransferase|nr:sulfurtransferase TusA family protein [Mediterranea sp.]
MTTVDTRERKQYSPLIPAITAICNGKPGDQIKIVMNDDSAFRDLKEYLAEQSIGFREIYDGDVMTVEFTL